MHLLRIEHRSSDYDQWKALFDKDPVDRAGKGVRRHQVLRAQDEPDFVCIELTFDSAAQAQTLLDAMGEVWKRVSGEVIFEPTARIFEIADDKQY